MKIQFLTTVAFFIIKTSLLGQISDIVKSEGIDSPVHTANIGKITFMAKVIPLENYKESDFLASFELKENADLNIRTFMGNSLTNYLHALAPGMPAEALTAKGNFQFAFYVDGAAVYTENLPLGAGSLDSKNTRTVFRIPLMSTTNEDSWGRFLWNRFMLKGGEDALMEGRHLLKIEIRPYLDNNGIMVGDIIASGQLELIVPPIFIPRKDYAIQAIKPKSGWEISNDEYGTDIILDLNRKIVARKYKEITAIAVIKEGKLILEEYFNGANRKSLADTRSVGKSFASALVGIAIGDGYLKNEKHRLHEFYDLKKYANNSPVKDSATLQDLLTMSSAFDGSDMDARSPGNEENMYPSANWVDFALNLPMNPDKTNGHQWDYFTAGVVLLGDILQKTVPGGLAQYADKKLFQPLGINKYKWQYTPQNVPNTAGGLCLRALDLAKFGQLYQQGGQWNGQQIIPKSWVEKSLSKQIQVSGAENEHYGFLFWEKTYTVDGRNYEVAYCSGNGGNKVFIFKNQPLVVVITSTAYNMPYAHSQVDNMMAYYIIPALAK